MAIRALEQNTVSEEVYNDEYFRRKDAEFESYKLKKQQQWIPCSERMPKDNEEVLVTYGDRVIISRYMGAGYGFICGLVDAWMPLPSQPYETRKSEEA
jgi:hypothetical protein